MYVQKGMMGTMNSGDSKLKKVAPGYYEAIINGRLVAISKQEEGGFWNLSIDGEGTDSANTKAQLVSMVEQYKERGVI